jgi:two-component system, NarL family, response regulator LiaR
MLKTILIYGFLLGVLVSTLHFIEYFFWVRMHIFEIYGGLIACLFLVLGLWFGRKTESKIIPITQSHLEINEADIAKLGISKRELDVLILMGQGHSNQQIADELFVSTNTVKTHTSRLFGKLEVKNRTQAIIKAQEIGLFNTDIV